ncbi:5'-methylthioadenosine/adenosylhomocysteine nucleosidase [Curvibacter delicatus]|jgi:adenosylhomocysteine nucleosidase|uniref:5'-methylthioadenosine/adenosylhomocysteine nucleosidase n=1 Tax=Curvibacter delicatus TaxID=80879 RepID=UPI000834287C|nr:5'-methylthioadenosine/adenosylhomocysteine nucleosidase [Curvibacter delicatus]
MAVPSQTTAILSALAEEQQGLLDLLHQPRCVTRAGREFWQGELHGQPVVLALSRIGKVAAATTATTLIEAFGAQRLVFTGVAGGVGPDVQVGDVVVATEFVQHDMDASPIFPRYQIPLYGRERFACDIALSALLSGAARAGLVRLEGQFDVESGRSERAVHHGLIASGDRFVSAAEEARRLHADLSDAGHPPLAVEMEGAAVAQVCHDYGIPFAAMRTISDRADDSAHVDFPKFVTEVASRYALAIIDEFVRQLPDAR